MAERQSKPQHQGSTNDTAVTGRKPGRPKGARGRTTAAETAADNGSRAVELSRWPKFCLQHLKDVFAEQLSELLRGESKSRDGRDGSTVRAGRASLRSLLDDVLKKTHERILESKTNGNPDQSGSAHRSERVNGVLKVRRLSASSLPYLLHLLAEDGVLHLNARNDLSLAQQLRNELQVDVSVYSGTVREHWAARAAQIFLKSIDRIGTEVWRATEQSGSATESENAPRTLNIGIVGGSTVQMVIEQLQESRDWEQDFGVSPRMWENIRVVALNVCLTQKEELSWNSNILVHGLCRAIRRQCRRVGGNNATVDGIGLLAPLLMPEKGNLPQDDDIQELLRITDPSLLNHDPSATPEDSKLNIVLTSVGTARDSIFRRWSRTKRATFNDKNRMVGDLLYSGFDSEGEPVSFMYDGKEVRFFSALSLETLQKLAKPHPCREVILIARRNQPGSEKHVAIHSAMQKHYASRLILDQITARALRNRLDSYPPAAHHGEAET